MKLKAILCLTVTAALLMLPLKGAAQTGKSIVINEIMVSNVGDVISPAINFDGWVELYNPSDQDISIGGFYVSDDEANLKRWQLPTSAGIIPAKGFMVIWFGSNDIKDNQAPFKLNCDGGMICLSDASGNLIVSQEYPMAISHTAWARKVDGTGDWGWTSTSTSGESNASAAFATQRLDAPVVDTDSKLFTGTLQVNVEIPSGARLMYTTDGSLPQAPKPDTGEEVSPWTQYVKNGNCEGSDASCFVCRENGKQDENRITNGVGVNGSRGVTVHSVANASNDWTTQFFVYTPDHIWKTNEYYRFKMKVRADKATKMTVQAHKTPGNHIANDMLDGSYDVTTEWKEISYEGKVTQSQAGESGGGWGWGWGGGNTEVTYSLQTIAFNLNVDKKDNNFYFDEISWESLDDGVEEESTLESKDGKFTMSKTTNYTFRLFQDGYLPSIPVTRSYIQTSNQYTLPVISIVGNKKFFTDPKIGLDCDGDGTNGKATSATNGQKKNYNCDWDRPVNFSFLSPEGEMLFNQDVNICVSGGYTRTQKFRSFKLKSNKIFDGLNRFDYPFFPQKPYNRNKVLLIRNGGNDVWRSGARFMDPALETIIQRSGIDLDVQSYVPIIEYVNGELRGVFNMREPNNDKYADANWGYDDEELDAFENLEMKNGDDVAIKRIIELGKQATDATAYKELKTLLDIDEFTNYMAVTFFLYNDDWPDNNMKAYRSRNDGRYRFISFDLDYAFKGCFGESVENPFTNFEKFKDDKTAPRTSYNKDIVNLFLNLLQNDEYRRKFINTFCVVGGSVFEPSRAGKIVDELLNKVKDMCQLMKNQGINDGHDPDRAATTIKDNLKGRSAKMTNYMQQFEPMKLSDAKKQTVILNADTDDAFLSINGINVPYADFNGVLFAPVRLEATAPAGYQFAGWKDGSGTIVSKNTIYDLPDDATVTITATFTQISSDEELLAQGVAPLRINEVSAGNSMYVNDWFKHNDWFEIYNTTDTDLDVAGLYVSDDEDNPMKYQIPTDGVLNTIIPARGHRIVWADEMDAVTQLHADFKLKNEDDKMVLVCSSDEFVANNQTYFNAHAEMREFADGITYQTHRGDQSVGRYPDGGKKFYKMYRPTIDRPNTLTSDDAFLGEDEGLTIQNREEFSLALAEGWNWMSHPMMEAIAADKLSGYANRIVGKDREAIRDSKAGMTGALKELEAGNLYKVQMRQNDTYTRKGFLCEDGRPVMLLPGWNWIGYTVSGQQALTAALADYLAEEGDKIVGQNGFAVYENGKWQGDLSTLETGLGYMLYTQQAKTLTFRSPAVKVRLRHTTHRQAARTRAASPFRPVSRHTYPNVMGIIAELQKDNEKVEPGLFSLYAYDADGECRGEGKWVNGLAWMTLYGKGGEALSYRAVDLLDGTVYTVRETMPFAEGITGSIGQPRVLTLGETEGSATMIDGIPVAPARTDIEGYYNLNGTRMSLRTAKRGIYLVKYKDGSFQKVIVK